MFLWSSVGGLGSGVTSEQSWGVGGALCSNSVVLYKVLANKENTSSIIMKIGLVWPIWYGPYGAIEYGPNVLRKLQGF